jgi:hypothetical protein
MSILKALLCVCTGAFLVGCNQVVFEKAPVKVNSLEGTASGGTTSGGTSSGGSSSGTSSGGTSSGGTSSGGSSSGSSSGGSSSGSSDGGSTSGGSTSGTSGGCDSTTVYNLYNTSVTHHNPNQNDVAVSCIDGAVDYNGNINFGPGDVYRSTRYGVTCASRWCANRTGDGNSVGVIESGISYNGNSLNLGANINIECRSNSISGSPGACETQIQNQPPLENRELNYSSCTPCGCNVTNIKSHWDNGPGDLVNCATQYCTGLGQGFQWGILSEVNDSGYLIRCSRAAF